MKKRYYFLFAFVLLMACNRNDTDDMDTTADLVFSYDPTCGECLNAKGEQGYNAFNLDNIIATKNAECVKFPEMHLVYVLDTTQIEAFYEYGDNQIVGYNFKGADLDATYIYFNETQKCSFEGTKMSQIQGGYTKLYGGIDSYTEYWEGCTAEQDSIYCRN